MSQIRIRNLSFCYEGSSQDIFNNVTFDIDTDWKLGFIGRNGRGKTTFLKLLMGNFAYQGTITANVNFEYFPFEGFDPKGNVEQIAQELQSDFQRWELVRELSLLKVEEAILDRPFETLSHGERTKVLLAILFLRPNAFLLIDEPTNHLDMKGRDVVGEYLGKKSGFILVSHDRAFLDRCIDHVLSINRSNIEIVRGNFNSWYENKRNQDELELAQNEKLKREIHRLSDASRQAADWSDKVEKTKYDTKNSGLKLDKGYVGHKAAKMMKRAKSLEKRQETAIEDKSKLLKNIETAESLKIQPLTFHSQRLITLSDVSLFYGEKEALSHVNLDVLQGERLALCGPNGCGKSSLLKLLYGEDLCFTGELRRAKGLKVSYVPQDCSMLQGLLSDFAREYGIEESLFFAILCKLDFSRAQFDIDMIYFSAGQKKKVLLAKSLCEQAHLYLWDEPLNYIDVLSRIQIEELLQEYRPTMVLVEHDRAFVEAIGARKLEL